MTTENPFELPTTVPSSDDMDMDAEFEDPVLDKMMEELDKEYFEAVRKFEETQKP